MPRHYFAANFCKKIVTKKRSGSQKKYQNKNTLTKEILSPTGVSNVC